MGCQKRLMWGLMAAAPQADVLLVQHTKSCLQAFLTVFSLAFSLETGNTIQKVAGSFSLACTRV